MVRVLYQTDIRPLSDQSADIQTSNQYLSDTDTLTGLVTNNLTQKSKLKFGRFWYSSSINIKVITTLQIYNIINKHVKLYKSNKDSLVTVHFLSIMTQKIPNYGTNVLPYIKYILSFYFFRNFLLTFLLPEQYLSNKIPIKIIAYHL